MMSRRTPIKEIIDEDSVPGSPRRKSTRLAAKIEEKDRVSTPVLKSSRFKLLSMSQDVVDLVKDDDEVSVSSNASSTSVMKATRASSKSPSRIGPSNGPARRTRSASTSSLLEEVVIPSSPLPRSRRVTRSMSTSPSADVQDNKLAEDKSQHSQESNGTTIKPKNLRLSFSEKITPMEAIEEKDNKLDNSIEIIENSQPDPNKENDNNLPPKKKHKMLNLQTIEEKSFTEDANDLESVTATITKPLPKFSLEKSNNKVEESQEERELVEILENKSHGTKEVEHDSLKVNTDNSEDLDSVFNSSTEGTCTEGKLADTSSSINNKEIVDTKISNKEIQNPEQEKVDLVVVVQELPSDKVTETIAKESEIFEPQLEIISNKSLESESTVEKTQVSNVAGEQEHMSKLPEVPIIPTLPTAVVSPANKEQIRRKSNRKSLSDTEEYTKKDLLAKSTTAILSENLSSRASTVNTKVVTNNLNVSGASDSSDKENQKNLNNDLEENEKSKSSEPLKGLSFCEPMEVEYASDVNNTLILSPKKSLNNANLKEQEATPIITPQSLKTSSQNKSLNASSQIINETQSASKESPKLQNRVENNDSSIVEESDVDPDEYEENHPSIIHTSDEEALTAERERYPKTSKVFKTPDLSKRPLLSEETYQALTSSIDEVDPSDDPDYEVESIVVEKDLSEKIADLIASHEGEESSEDESVTHFIDEFAEEGEEDTPSEGSNDIIEVGESLGDSDTDNPSDESYEADSFIDDNEQNELLSGNEYDLDFGVQSKTIKKSRIIIESDTEDVLVNGQQEDDLEHMSTRPYCGLSPPSVMSIRDSPSLEDRDQDEQLSNVLINKEDNLQSLEEIKQISPAKTLVVKKSPQSVAKINTVTPNNSLTDTSMSHRPGSIQIQANITADDIEQGGIGERINKVIDVFYTNVKETSLNSSASFSINISLECVENASPVKSDKQSLENKIEKPLSGKKQKLTGILNDANDTLLASKIPVRLDIEAKKKKSKMILTPDKKVSINETLISGVLTSTPTLDKSPIVQLETVTEPKPKKTKTKKNKSIALIKSTELESNVHKESEIAVADDSGMSTDLDIVQEERKPKKRTRKHHDVEEVPPVKKVKQNDKATSKKQKSKKVTDLQSEWVVEKCKVSYFPSALLNIVSEKPKKVSDRIAKQIPRPSTDEDRKSWGFTKFKRIVPSTSNQSTPTEHVDSLSHKDYKKKMLFDSNRVKREDMKTHLKKKKKQGF